MPLSALLSAAFLPLVCGFYVPGFSPNEYKIGDDAVKLASPKTQLPYDYYHLHYCKPENGDFEYDSGKSFMAIELLQLLINSK
ncbi:hypothetical protein AAHC03_013268 [Spirometra sp. Aus1]